MRAAFLLIFSALCSTPVAYSQPVNGEVVELKSDMALGKVSIYNLHTNNTIYTNDSGKFTMEVEAGQLLTFRKEGYKIEKLRVPEGKMPPYLKVFLEKLRPEEQTIAQRNWKRDSAMYRELYKKELEFPKFTALDMIQHPFSAMSKRNQEIWAFQKEYEFFEEQKFIDYTFNDELITRLTGISDADSIRLFKSWFRPTAPMIRNMSLYDFFTYIKRSGDAFKEGRNPRRPNIRQSN